MNDDYEARSDKVADALRALIATLASAGSGLVYAARGQTEARILWLFPATNT